MEENIKENSQEKPAEAPDSEKGGNKASAPNASDSQSEQQAKQPTNEAGSDLTLEAQLEKLQADYDKMREVAAYAQADVINIRARSEREIAKARAFGSERAVTAVLPVLDNLDRALQSAASDPSKIAEGVKMLRTQFADALKSLGVTEVDPLGETFSPLEHDAMSTAPVADKEQDGKIIAVVNKGYKLSDKVIRPAMVMVGKYTEPAQEQK